MKVFVLLVLATLALAHGQVSKKPGDARYPYSKWVQIRHPRDVSVDPKTGTINGNYPVGQGDIYGKVAGSMGEFGYKGNIFDDHRGKLDGQVYHGRDLGRDTSGMGGRLNWGSDRGSKATLDLNRMDKTWNAAGGGRWQINKDWSAGAHGTYSKTPGMRSDYGVMGTLNGRFPG